MKSFFCFILTCLCVLLMCFSLMHCGVPGSIQGGSKDTTLPYIVKTNIQQKQTNVPLGTKKFSMVCSEFVNIRDPSKIVINPSFQTPLKVFFNKRKITIGLDSIKPQTTYKLDFKNYIQDLNEGNAIENVEWIFSTGRTIDTFSLHGKIVNAETNEIDTLTSIILYATINDSVAIKQKPNYITKPNAKGEFLFTHLKPQPYLLFALENAESVGSYTNSQLKFAFLDQPIQPIHQDSSFLLRVFAEKKIDKKKEQIAMKNGKKIARYTSNLNGQKMDLETPLKLTFNTSIQSWDLTKILLCDTAFETCDAMESFLKYDTITNTLLCNFKWEADEHYNLIIQKKFIRDSSLDMQKDDTLKMQIQPIKAYGKALIEFNDTTIHKPLLRIKNGDEVIATIPLIPNQTIATALLKPNKYKTDIVSDRNQNKQWDKGDYKLKIQPEWIYQTKQELEIVEDKLINYKIKLK